MHNNLSLTHIVALVAANHLLLQTIITMPGDDDGVIENFDVYQKRVLDTLRENTSLKNDLTKLQADVEELSRTKDLLEKKLTDRDLDLDNISKVLMQNVNESMELLKNLRQEVVDKKKLSEIQYELDICLSCKRSLERDCMLQKNENQRLLCVNSQLSQELKTIKHNEMYHY